MTDDSPHDIPTPTSRSNRARWPILRNLFIIFLICAAAPIFFFFDGNTRLFFLLPLLFAYVVYMKHRDRLSRNEIIIHSGIGLVILGIVTSYLAGALPRLDRPKTPKVVLFGPRGDTHWQVFLEGFKSAFSQNCINGLFHASLYSYQDGEKICTLDISPSIDGKPVSVPIIFRDLPDDSDAAKKVIQEVINDRQVILISGFVTSTSASEALTALHDKFPDPSEWPTVILPMATASSLIVDSTLTEVRPVLRIVPSNLAQAERIASDIAGSDIYGQTNATRTAAPSFQNRLPTLAIFRDADNPVYSDDLANSLRSSKDISRIRVIFDASIGSKFGGSAAPDSLCIYKPDFIAYLGMPRFGLIFAQQIKLLIKQNEQMKGNISDRVWNPTIIFSDGSVSSDICQVAGHEQLKGIIGYFPHGELSSHLADKHQNDGRFAKLTPSFLVFGHDTATIINAILSASDNLNRKDTGIALQRIKKQSVDTTGSVGINRNSLLSPYQFTDDGEVKNLTYHRWIFDGSDWVNAEKK
jgi:hypothetical protein